MKLTFNTVQKAVLEADDAKGTGYDVKANQFSVEERYRRTKDWLGERYNREHAEICYLLDDLMAERGKMKERIRELEAGREVLLISGD